jgi:hypothetical protein
MQGRLEAATEQCSVPLALMPDVQVRTMEAAEAVILFTISPAYKSNLVFFLSQQLLVGLYDEDIITFLCTIQVCMFNLKLQPFTNLRVL